ncbi:hypothetical protein OG552_29550 [Streptomyces sp. NBC_01476]|uniref:hypothetical protein n=1 Tax=Streptomyces sp. NBC_01476 TaxID=2903881 RepID=UPI002E334CE9|nr:hypothetical protein [Streptomyces sp. NBC_01476]
MDEGGETWGWDARSLSGPVAGDRWLRLLAVRAEKASTAAWDGPETAEKAIPATVPRPRLHAVHDWSEADYAYRAELYERVHASSLSKTALAPASIRLPDTWWTSLRVALAAVASTPTDRTAVRQERLHWAMPQFLETDLDTTVPQWSTTHADIQWSNLAGPDLCILDWERWGLAPTGYDEACLYISSLAVPEIAEQVHETFREALDSQAGRFSQLVVASEFLQGIQRGNNLELETPLRRHVDSLLEDAQRQ